jgi:predicted MFS family arabinose efflux permease
MALLSSGINFLAAGTSLVVILLAQAQGASSLVIGLILGIAGIGSIAGSLIAPLIQRRVRFGRAIAMTMWINAILWPLYIIAPNPLALGSVTALIFVNGPIYNVVNIAYRLALVPDELQGRVNSVVRLISLGAIPPGLALAGLLLQQLGATATVVVLAPGYLFLALAATLNSALRRAQPTAQHRAK